MPAVHSRCSDARCWAGNRRPDTGARCSGQGESPGDVWALLSIRTLRTAMSAWGPAEEVDEGVERHGADWQGIKEPYQLDLMPSMDAISGHGVTMLSGRRMLSGHDGSVLLDDPYAVLPIISLLLLSGVL